jgi:hypothetical protein
MGSRRQASPKIRDLGLHFRNGRSVDRRVVPQAFQLNFAAQQLIGKAVELA